MADDITIPLTAIGGGGGVLSLIGGFFLRSHNARLRNIEEGLRASAIADAALNASLAEHKLDAEKRYAKEESVQQSLARIHGRLDETATKDDVKELRDDIKKLMGKVGA